MKREFITAAAVTLFATAVAFGQGTTNENNAANDQTANGNTQFSAEYHAPANQAGDPTMDQGYGPKKGDWELTLGGSGTSNNSFDNGSGAISGQLGYYLSDEWEVGVRQGVGFAGSSSSSSWNARTDAFIDYNFDLGKWRPYVGASIGYIYGDDTHDTAIAGPEAGVKYYVKPDTFIYGNVAYQWTFTSTNSAGDNFNDGLFTYGVGIGFNF